MRLLDNKAARVAFKEVAGAKVPPGDMAVANLVNAAKEEIGRLDAKGGAATTF